ncbi:MAG: hypothetical protein OSA84_07495 [Akkermansiaceae bacterium]|nr:hypothetical protein [Akkermansiaceae bacterium]
MPDTEVETGKKRRWSGFVCPDCRFVFRVPRDHDGEGIICPSCRRMLRIPGEGEESAPLMAPLQKVDFAEEEPDPRGEKRVRAIRKKQKKEAEVIDWDASPGRWRETRKKGKRVIRPLLGWIISIGAVIGMVFLIVKARDADKAAAGDNIEEMQDQFDQLVNTPLILPDEELVDPVDLPKIMERSEADFIGLAQPLAEKFFAAKKIEDILPIVYDPKGVWKKIRAYYPGGVISPLEISKFNSTGRVSYKDNFAAVSIMTADFEQKQLAFIEDDEGLKVDWESWTGWSEMPWAEIIKKKPGEPVLVRATLKWVDYYNFAFSDESKWRSYRLTSPDGENMLYGYAARNSLLDQRIRPGEPKSNVAVIVKIHYPEDAQSDKQVVISEYVADGWVIAGEGE